ncbi:MAG: glycoside hydrolase family 65 protein, partial [Deltaproteobacteria bacterium]|nr:glycoside hydrolase family 65 protein [Deltaproteobacteria bacterium]
SLRVAVGGERLDVTTMDVQEHSRILDMRRGLVARRTLYSTATGKGLDYQSLRFFSLHSRHVAVMQVAVTPLDQSCLFTIVSSVDCSVTNRGLVTEGEKRHFHIAEFLKKGSVNYICNKTLEKEILIAYASQMTAAIQRREGGRNVSRRRVEFKVNKGETLFLTKYFALFTSRDVPARRIKTRTLSALQQSVKKGFSRLLAEHCRAWDDRWRRADIRIDGDHDAERALRFNVYHLLAAASDSDPGVSVGAKGLSGEGYRGHVFWDTEIFVLPFFTFTAPQTARTLLRYRYAGLEAAREKARQNGFRGAMFPWESADTGEDVTPTWHKDFDGRVIKISTMHWEHHITADIAYGTYQYFQATDDVGFMLDYGLEMLLESARFWASRVTFDARLRRYEIHHVTGPDEFHEDVDNNVFTNAMAQWNLQTARSLYLQLRRKHPGPVRRLMTKIGMRKSEVEGWRLIADRMWLPVAKDSQVLESFEGYFRRKKLPRPAVDGHGLPHFPKGLSLSRIGMTQFVKQADAVMLLYLLPERFDPETKRKSFLYYEPRTLHKSSLSPAIHAAVAAELGKEELAYRSFRTALYTDLTDTYGNTKDGVHAATMGGAWQAAVCGFAGVRAQRGMLTINPHLPPAWKRLSFSIQWRQLPLEVSIDKETVQLRLRSADTRKTLPLRVYGKPEKLVPNRTTTFRRKPRERPHIELDGMY